MLTQGVHTLFDCFLDLRKCIYHPADLLLKRLELFTLVYIVGFYTFTGFCRGEIVKKARSVRLYYKRVLILWPPIPSMIEPFTIMHRYISFVRTIIKYKP